MPSLSLVIIGKNDFVNLKNIYTEKRLRTLSQFFVDMIYVDSLSTDSSVELMKNKEFSVCQLTEDSYKSAAAGRWVGTQQANGDYVLFLDSDMELIGIEYLLDEVNTAIKLGFVGLVGDVEDIYPNGRCRHRMRKQNLASREANSFGGFVLIKRDCLNKVGNWNPFLPANEELELFARLKKFNFSIYKSERLKVKHYTIVTSAISELIGLYFPLRKQRYGSYGFALASAFRRNSLVSLLKISPEPLYFLFAFLLCIFLILNGTSIFTPVVIGLYIKLTTLKRSLKYCIVPPGIVLSCLVGIIRYKETQVNYEKM